MGNEQHRALGKPALKGGLHLELCPRVHGGCGLVQDEDLGFPEKGTCQTQQLLLAQAGREWDSQARCFVCLHIRVCRACPKCVSTIATKWWVPSPQSWKKSPSCQSLTRATSGKSFKPTMPQFP